MLWLFSRNSQRQNIDNPVIKAITKYFSNKFFDNFPPFWNFILIISFMFIGMMNADKVEADYFELHLDDTDNLYSLIILTKSSQIDS